MGANDDAGSPWLGPVKELIRDAVADGVPTLGICLGHQLSRWRSAAWSSATRAASRSACSPSAGPTRPPTTRCCPRSATPRRGVQWNDDVVTDCPRAPSCSPRPRRRGPGGRFAPTVWGVQLHPEVDEPIVRPWADADRELAERRASTPTPLLAEIEAARDELDDAWRAAGRRVRRRVAGERRDLTAERPAAATCCGSGSSDPSRARRRSRSSATPPSRWSRCSAAPPTPTWRWPRWSRLAERGRRPRPSCCTALADDEGTAMRLLSRARRQRGARRPPVPSPRALARAHRPDARLDPPGGVRRARGRCSRPSAPTRATDARSPTLPDAAAVDALRVEYRRLLLRLAARDLAHHLGVDDVAAELVRPRGRHARRGLAVARAKVGEAAARCRLAVIAMGKCGGHELNYVCDVDVIFVAEPVEGARRGEAACGPPPSSPRTLMRVCSEHTAEGTIWPVDANLRPEGKSGPLVRTLASHRGYYERWAKTWEFQALLKARPVAGDLDARPGVRRAGRARWCGRRRRARRLRRGRAGDAPPGARAHPGAARPSGSSSSAPAGCATSSSPSSCSRWCTAAPTRRSAPPTTLSALAALTERRVRRPRGRRGAARRLRVPAHPRAPDPALPAAPHPRRARGRGRRCAGSAASLGYTKEPVATLDKRVAATTAARSAGCTRSSSTGRCSPRWRGCPATRRGSAAEAADAAAGGARLRGPEAALRHLEALTAGVTRTAQHPAHAAAGDARVVRRRARPGRRPVRLPPDLSEALGRTPWYLATAARRGRGRPAAGAGARHHAATPPTCSSASRRAWRMLGERSARAAGPRRRSRREMTVAGRAARGRRGGGAARSGRSAAASCCGSASADLRGLFDVAEVGDGAVPAHRRDAGGDARGRRPRSVRGSEGRRRRRPGWRSSRWAATAGSSCPTAATPT